MTLVIVGISGDLAQKKLLPALHNLTMRGELPFEKIIGTSRRSVSVDAVQVLELDPTDASAWGAHKAQVGPGPHLFYLAVPPGTAPAIARALASAGFSTNSLALEKPFGFDTASSAGEAQQIAKYFPADQIYRIDHYLYKKLAAEIANQGRSAQKIEVLASEDTLVGSRAGFYERTGALRDFGNHALSLAAVALGGISVSERTRILCDLQFISASRAQYDGYAAEAGNPTSETETFFQLELRSGATSVVLASGKGLAKKYTAARIDGKKFADTPDGAYEEVFLALARNDRERFLTGEEVAQSWRLMDQGRAKWGEIKKYPRGSVLEELL